MTTVTEARSVGLCVFAYTVIACGCAGNNGATRNPAADPRPGDELYLVNGNPALAVCGDQDAMRELIKSIRRDNAALTVFSFLTSGKAIVVDAGTKVRVLRVDELSVQVLVLEGEHADYEGWVYRDWFSNTRPANTEADRQRGESSPTQK